MTSKAVLKLPENLTIANVNTLHEQMEALINRQENDTILVHGQSVARADTAGVQLLLALVNSARERSIGLSWKSPSAALCEAVATLGLDNIIGIHHS